MTVYVGPGIVSEGLIFHYNTDSEMAYKGKPTINLWHNQAAVSDLNEFDSWSMPGVPGAASTITKDYGVWNGSTKSSIWKVTVGTGSMQSYASWRLCLDTGLTSIATTRRLQAKVKMLKGSISDLGYHNGGGTGSATYTPIDPGEIPGGVTDNTGWYQLSVQVNWTSTTTGQCVGIGILSQDIEFLVAEPMIATDATFTVPYTPNERDNTEVLYDGTGTNTLTATNLTYNSDGTTNFSNSTPDKVTIPSTSSITPTTEYSAEAWVWADSSQNNPYPRVWDKGHILCHISQTAPFNIAQNTTINDGSNTLRQVNSSTNNFPHSTWTHIHTSYDGQYGKVYINGALVNTTNFGSVVNILDTSSFNLVIGSNSGTGRDFNGKISDMKFYNRTLTDKEVQQNFEAGRYKYGI